MYSYTVLWIFLTTIDILEKILFSFSGTCLTSKETKSRNLVSLALSTWKWQMIFGDLIEFWEVILGLVIKSNLPTLVYILPYEVWLWGQKHGCNRVICVLSLKMVNLTTQAKFRLFPCVGKVEIKPIVDYYGKGQR